MKRNYVERATTFVSEFFRGDIPMNDYFCVSERVDAFNNKYKRHVILRTGCVRMALITSDYVVKWDYDREKAKSLGGCENECKFYKKAEEDGMAHLFAKVTKVKKRGRCFYVMPRISRLAEDDWEISYLEDYLTQDEMDYLDEYVEDLHGGNWGLNKEGHAVVIDYACQKAPA